MCHVAGLAPGPNFKVHHSERCVSSPLRRMKWNWSLFGDQCIESLSYNVEFLRKKWCIEDLFDLCGVSAWRSRRHELNSALRYITKLHAYISPLIGALALNSLNLRGYHGFLALLCDRPKRVCHKGQGEWWQKPLEIIRLCGRRWRCVPWRVPWPWPTKQPPQARRARYLHLVSQRTQMCLFS